VAYVGDRHPQAKALAFASAEHRVVEVFRGFAVDGDEREAAQILSSAKVLLANRIGRGLRLHSRPLRELVRQIELANGDLDLHPGIGVMSEHLGDAPDRLRVAAGRRDQVDRDYLSGLRAPGLRRRHQDVVRDAPVFRHEKEDTVLGMHTADDAARAALEHFHHGAERTAALVASAYAHGGAIAVDHLAHLRGRQEHRRPAFVGHEKAVAVGVAFDAPGDERDALCDEQRAGAVLDDFARALERSKRLVERLPLALLDREALSELVRREGRARAVQRFADLMPVFGCRRRRPFGTIAAPKRCFLCLFL
jgi:hypothetical protein